MPCVCILPTSLPGDAHREQSWHSSLTELRCLGCRLPSYSSPSFPQLLEAWLPYPGWDGTEGNDPWKGYLWGGDHASHVSRPVVVLSVLKKETDALTSIWKQRPTTQNLSFSSLPSFFSLFHFYFVLVALWDISLCSSGWPGLCNLTV